MLVLIGHLSAAIKLRGICNAIKHINYLIKISRLRDQECIYPESSSKRFVSFGVHGMPLGFIADIVGGLEGALHSGRLAALPSPGGRWPALPRNEIDISTCDLACQMSRYGSTILIPFQF